MKQRRKKNCKDAIKRNIVSKENNYEIPYVRDLYCDLD